MLTVVLSGLFIELLLFVFERVTQSDSDTRPTGLSNVIYNVLVAIRCLPWQTG